LNFLRIGACPRVWSPSHPTFSRDFFPILSPCGEKILCAWISKQDSPHGILLFIYKLTSWYHHIWIWTSIYQKRQPPKLPTYPLLKTWHAINFFQLI
jgi:hypothetical protein